MNTTETSPETLVTRPKRADARRNYQKVLAAAREAFAEGGESTALEEIARLVPGSRAPSVLPLAEPGMVAVHSVVPAADVFKLLPELEAAGATSILLVPLERMLA